MSDFVFIKPDVSVTAGPLGGFDRPFPVRRERADAVLRGDRVNLDALLDELATFLDEHPECARAYRAAAPDLAWIVGLDMAGQGLWEAAAHYFGVGLRLDPGSLSLLSHRGLARQMSGQPGPALADYRAVLGHPECGPAPQVRALAARCCAELGRCHEARALLDPIAMLMPREPAFWDFLGDMRAQGPAAAPPPPPPPLAQPADRAFCTNCGNAIHPGDRFCTRCGARLL